MGAFFVFCNILFYFMYSKHFCINENTSVIMIGVRSCYDEGKRTAETLTMDYHRGANLEVFVPSKCLISIAFRLTFVAVVQLC